MSEYIMECNLDAQVGEYAYKRKAEIVRCRPRQYGRHTAAAHKILTDRHRRKLPTCGAGIASLALTAGSIAPKAALIAGTGATSSPTASAHGEKGKSHERCNSGSGNRADSRGAVAAGAVRGREEEMTDVGWVITIVVLVASFCIFEEWMEGKR